MKTKSNPEELVTVSVRVPRHQADTLRILAAFEHRTLSGELRRLIADRIADGDRERQAA